MHNRLGDYWTEYILQAIISLYEGGSDFAILITSEANHLYCCAR